ncbi:MAG: deoxynucleoside kinase [Bacteroidetes bacterium]|nr:MAG: deoxynucleoside kinase [Bacteroidota bacterium]
MANRHIAIAGNIGAGKTTLTGRLAQVLGWTAQYENPDSNPYIADFYKDMRRWGFNMQIHFLYSRIAKLKELRAGNENIIQDRTIYEDIYIFAPNLVEMGVMSQRDYVCYANLFEQIKDFLQPPDLLIYLRGSDAALKARIEQRNRHYEQSIRTEYLRALNRRYDSWIETYDLGPVYIVDIDRSNFNHNEKDLQRIAQDVRQHLQLPQTA